MLARLDLDPAEKLIPVLFGLTAAAVGFAAGIDPRLAVAGALGVSFLLLALASLPAGVIAFTLIVFMELAPAIGGPALSFTKIAGAVLALSWLAKFAYRERYDDVFWAEMPTLFTVLMALVAWTVASYFWAEDPGRSLGTISKVILNAALFVIVFDALKKPAHVRALALAFVAGASLAAAYGLVAAPDASRFAYSATSSEGLGRIAGTVGDPNVLAALLVAGLVLALALAATSQHAAATRAFALGAVLLLTAGIALTGSRGGLVALAAALLGAFVLSPPRRRAMAGATALVLAGAVTLYYTALAPQGAQERLTTADGGSGRTDIWKVGWRMVEANPIIGVGAANFQVASIHYLLAEPGAIESDSYIVDQPSVAHNTYLEVLAEFGVIGLTLFALVLIGSIACAARAARIFARSGERDMEILSIGFALAVVSVLAADFFISEQFNKHLWLLLSVGPVLLSAARRSAAGESAELQGKSSA